MQETSDRLWKVILLGCALSCFEGGILVEAFLLHSTTTTGTLSSGRTAVTNHASLPYATTFIHSSNLLMSKSGSLSSTSLSPSRRRRDGASSQEQWSTLQEQPRRPPTNDEQLELLSEAVELRRLQKVEMDQLAGGGKQSLPKLILCRASGYGDELDAYETALERGRLAREELITRNMGLVYYVVKDLVGTPKHMKRTLQSLSIDDLIQEGSIGLSRAVGRWNPEIGGKFSTYAVYWIRAAVLRCIAERDDLVRVPEHVSSTVRKISSATKQLGMVAVDQLISGAGGQELVGDYSYGMSLHPSSSSWEEAKAARRLAEAAGISEAQLGYVLQVERRRRRGGILSFETWMQQGKDLESDHSDASYLTTGSSSSSSLDLEHLRLELAKFLRPKEAEALSWRYGLKSDSSEQSQHSIDGDNPPEPTTSTSTSARTSMATRGKWGEAMSFDEVGKRMHVSAEYGRRLCQKALSKLRLAHEQGRLEPSALAL